MDDGNGTAVLSELTGSYWWITGKIFMWYDAENHTTTGDGPHVVTTASIFHVSSSITKTANRKNETPRYNVDARRRLELYSTLNLSQGKELATWSQRLTFSNSGSFRDRAYVQENNQHTRGYDASSGGYAKLYHYPLYAYSVEGSIKDNITIIATANCGKNVKTIGRPVFLGL